MGMTILGGVILIPDYEDRIVSHGVSSFFFVPTQLDNTYAITAHKNCMYIHGVEAS